MIWNNGGKFSLPEVNHADRDDHERGQCANDGVDDSNDLVLLGFRRGGRGDRGLWNVLGASPDV